MVHKIRRVWWTDRGQRICLQHKSWRKLRGGSRGPFWGQIMTTYLLKRHQRRIKSITLPRHESRGLEIMVTFCSLHAGRNTSSRSQGLTWLFHMGSGEGCRGRGVPRGGGRGRVSARGGCVSGVGCLPAVGCQGWVVCQVWEGGKQRFPNLNWNEA